MALAWAVDEDQDNGESEQQPLSLYHPPGSGQGNGESEQRIEAPAPRTLSIVVAEDEAPLRWSISAILESAGHRVIEAEDGQAVLDLFQVQTFDVLVIDLHMPKLDGIAVLRQVPVPPLIVIVYSAFAYFLVDAVRDAVGPKVFRYMQKPVPPLELIAAINEAAAELDC